MDPPSRHHKRLRHLDQSQTIVARMKWRMMSEVLLDQIASNFANLSRLVHVKMAKYLGEKSIFVCQIPSLADEPKKKLLLHGECPIDYTRILNVKSTFTQPPFVAPSMGRSSRPTFSVDASTAENEYLLSIETWRQVLGLEKFILLGHSFGGFLAAAYTLKYHQRVCHLILEDPWGIGGLTALARAVGPVLQVANPLKALRGAYWFGPTLFKKHPLLKRFHELVKNSEEVFPSYMYQLNAQQNTGYGFHSIMQGLLHAKHPIIDRMDDMPKEMPITFIYGERSWMERSSGYQIKEERFNSYVDVKVIERCGHDVHVEKYEEFNLIANETCSLSDSVERRNNADPL
ncbi:unnamed protein product, partial [Meganyctiphanes norvegica]